MVRLFTFFASMSMVMSAPDPMAGMIKGMLKEYVKDKQQREVLNSMVDTAMGFKKAVDDGDCRDLERKAKRAVNMVNDTMQQLIQALDSLPMASAFLSENMKKLISVINDDLRPYLKKESIEYISDSMCSDIGLKGKKKELDDGKKGKKDEDEL